ncbi:MAG TPA: hypothetical protein VF904_15265 [Anaeromyxobacteraceae bacterium]
MKGVIRPEAVVLDDSAVVPKGRRISPPPNQFTHELARAQRYGFTGAADEKPSGELPAGAKVVLIAYDGGSHCHVIDARGLYVRLEYDALKKITR